MNRGRGRETVKGKEGGKRMRKEKEGREGGEKKKRAGKEGGENEGGGERKGRGRIEEKEVTDLKNLWKHTNDFQVPSSFLYDRNKMFSKNLSF